jgi:hypothetical protein
MTEKTQTNAKTQGITINPTSTNTQNKTKDKINIAIESGSRAFSACEKAGERGEKCL